MLTLANPDVRGPRVWFVLLLGLILLAGTIRPAFGAPPRSECPKVCQARARAALALSATCMPHTVAVAPMPKSVVMKAACACGDKCECPAGTCPACPAAAKPSAIATLIIGGVLHVRGPDGSYSAVAGESCPNGRCPSVASPTPRFASPK